MQKSAKCKRRPNLVVKSSTNYDSKSRGKPGLKNTKSHLPNLGVKVSTNYGIKSRGKPKL